MGRWALVVAGVLMGCAEPAPEEVAEASRCITEPQPWVSGTPAFREVTKQWNIKSLAVYGHQVNVTDIDGDLWPDLVVHYEGGQDDFASPDSRASWMLRNMEGQGFEDVTEVSGFRERRKPDDATPDLGRPGQIMASADVDNDGDLDIYTAAWYDDPDAALDTCELMLNDGDGNFELGPGKSDARLTNLRSNPFSVSFTDYDLDGLVDLWFVQNGWYDPYPQQDRLFRNKDGTEFVDKTFAAGMETLGWEYIENMNAGIANSWGWSATACDLNNDGAPELLAASYGRTPNHLWQHSVGPNGKVTYLNRSVDSGYAFDENQDWTDDINARCYCRDNPDAEDCHLAQPAPEGTLCDDMFEWFGGVYRWEHSSAREPAQTGGVSASTVCADVNNDGFMDLLTGEIAHPDTGKSSDRAELVVNTGEADVRFERPGMEATGLLRPYQGWEIDEGVMNNMVFDFDNDGWQDVYFSVSGYPNNFGHLYRQVAPLLFEEMSWEDGLEQFESHGSQSVDLDRDGDLDVVVAHLPVYCGADWGAPDCYDPPFVRVFENLAGDQVNWVQLKLIGGEGTNKAAIGARVQVDNGDFVQTQEVDGGHGRNSTQRDLVLHFGLGDSCTAEVEVRWPDLTGTTQSFTLDAGRLYQVEQGGDPVSVELAGS